MVEYRVKDEPRVPDDDLGLIILEDGDDATQVKENALKSQLERLYYTVPFALQMKNYTHRNTLNGNLNDSSNEHIKEHVNDPTRDQFNPSDITESFEVICQTLNVTCHLLLICHHVILIF